MSHNRANVQWTIPPTGTVTIEQAHLATLMDIRTELHELNRLLNCTNFIGIPITLRAINRKLAKPREKKS